MKRLVLCALAVLLTSGAFISSKPAFACTVDPVCASEGCDGVCFKGGNCNYCTGHCRCFP
jgi:hypothetical protein